MPTSWVTGVIIRSSLLRTRTCTNTSKGCPLHPCPTYTQTHTQPLHSPCDAPLFHLPPTLQVWRRTKDEAIRCVTCSEGRPCVFWALMAVPAGGHTAPTSAIPRPHNTRFPRGSLQLRAVAPGSALATSNGGEALDSREQKGKEVPSSNPSTQTLSLSTVSQVPHAHSSSEGLLR